MTKLKNKDNFIPGLAQVITSLLILLFCQNLLGVIYKVLYWKAPSSRPALTLLYTILTEKVPVSSIYLKTLHPFGMNTMVEHQALPKEK